MNRTYIIFKSKEAREAAIDFLLKLNVNFQCNVIKEADKPCWLSVAPRIFSKNCLDLYLSGMYANCYSSFIHKTQKL